MKILPLQAVMQDKHKVVAASIVAVKIHKNYFLFLNFIQLIPQLIKINISNM